MNYYIKGLRTAQCSKTGEQGGNCALYTLSYFLIFVPCTWIFHLTTKKQAIKNLPTLNIWKLSKTQVIEWMWKSPENERHLHRSRILELLGYIKIHKEMGLKHRLPGLTSRHWFSMSVVGFRNLQFLTSTPNNSNSDAFDRQTIFW